MRREAGSCLSLFHRVSKLPHGCLRQVPGERHTKIPNRTRDGKLRNEDVLQKVCANELRNDGKENRRKETEIATIRIRLAGDVGWLLV